MLTAIGARISGGALGLLFIVTTANAFYEVRVNSQTVTNNQVTIASVSATKDSLIVIFPANEAGDPDTKKALGQLPVRAGESTDVKVPLERTVAPGDRLIAVLFSDAGEKGKFELGTDKPILRPVSNHFTVE